MSQKDDRPNQDTHGEKYPTSAKDCICGMTVCRCPVDYIVYYIKEEEWSGKDAQWKIERTSDNQEMERGSLKDMMALIMGSDPKYQNGRRAHLAEDMLRIIQTISMDFPDIGPRKYPKK